MVTLPALTVWQPWAALIILGAKPYEFRGWPAPPSLRGKRIAIHAGARPMRRSEIDDLRTRLRSDQAWTTCLRPEIALPFLDRCAEDPRSVPLSHVLGTAILGQPVPAWDIVGEFGAVLTDSDRAEHSNWAWPLTAIVPAAPPVLAKGAQGFWHWREEALA